MKFKVDSKSSKRVKSLYTMENKIPRKYLNLVIFYRNKASMDEELLIGGAWFRHTAEFDAEFMKNVSKSI